MASSTTHPHLAVPSGAALREPIARLHPHHAELCPDAHLLVVDSVPGVCFEVDQDDGASGCGARPFGCCGWGVAAREPGA